MNYDIMFFEALGEENSHIEQELKAAFDRGSLPGNLKYLISTDTVQDYLSANPDTVLPDIISTKTQSRLPQEWIYGGNKKSVISRSAGYDHFEALADAVNVTSLRKYCVNAVAETAAKFVLCACGEIASETVLLKLYKSGHIFGIGADTFSFEEGIAKILSGQKTTDTDIERAQAELIRMSLARSGNIYTQPHQGFNSDKAALDKAKEAIKHLEAYYKNDCKRFDSQLPYYK